MTAPRPVDARTRIGVALAIVVFLVAATVPYLWLIEHFGYDDILREPTPVILARFSAGGVPLILAWFGFAMSALLFIPVGVGVTRLGAAPGAPDTALATLGIASAVAQAIGLSRWVLVVPGLAASYLDPASTPWSREMLVIVFDAVHRYGGMVIGELIGQLLLAGWTALAAWQLMRQRIVPAWLAAIGMATVPLWILGQTELLHEVAPSIPALEVIPVAFMAWEAWLAAIAIWLLAGIRVRSKNVIQGA